MLKILIKKQLGEVFRNYFYDPKKNAMRSKKSIICWFIFFGFAIVGILGGLFTSVALSMAFTMIPAGLGWLYFAMMSGVAILIGAFGSVFNTYAGLYLAKDNDLLLSMPVPVNYIVISRLANVYLLGALYSCTAIVPGVVLYLIVAGFSLPNVLCGLLMTVIVTVIVLLLSCLLGFVVAKISGKLKNKSFVSVFVALAVIFLYYFFYFKAGDFLSELVLNAAEFGEKIKSAAYPIYVFGSAGAGNLLSMLAVIAVTALLAYLTWLLLRRTFLSIATASGDNAKVRYKAKAAKETPVFAALLKKEFSKFTSSANYMLNCGLGVLLIPAGGIGLLIKGRELTAAINGEFGDIGGAVAVLFCGAVIAISAMNDMAAPSVSLEGKSVWVLQSLPVDPKYVLRAKMTAQLIVSGVPVMFATVCALTVIRPSVLTAILTALFAMISVFFTAVFDILWGVKFANTVWTNETMPLKQSAPVFISLFAVWGIASVFISGYFLFGRLIGADIYLAVSCAVFAAVSLILLRWVDTKGAKHFAEI